MSGSGSISEMAEEVRSCPDVGFFFYMHGNGYADDDFEGPGNFNYVRALDNLTEKYQHSGIDRGNINTVIERSLPAGDSTDYKSRTSKYPDSVFQVGGPVTDTARNEEVWKKEVKPEGMVDRILGRSSDYEMPVDYKEERFLPISSILDNSESNSKAYFVATNLCGEDQHLAGQFGRPAGSAAYLGIISWKGPIEHIHQTIQDPESYDEFIRELLDEENYPNTHEDLVKAAQTPDEVHVGWDERTEVPRQWREPNHMSDLRRLPDDFPEEWEIIEK